VVVEECLLASPADPYLSLRAVVAYSGLGLRTLRARLSDVDHPLPCYRVGGKILVRRSEFDAWVARYRQVGPAEVTRVVTDILGTLAAPGRGPRGSA
jgi:hypothetical protein